MLIAWFQAQTATHNHGQSMGNAFGYVVRPSLRWSMCGWPTRVCPHKKQQVSASMTDSSAMAATRMAQQNFNLHPEKC